MGVRFPSVFTNTFIGPLPANATETVVFTTPPLTLPLDGAVVFLGWQCIITPGTSVTSQVYRIRRGTTTAGAQISPQFWASIVTAGNVDQRGGFYFDTPGAVAGQQYSLTVVQTAATVAGIFQDGALMAFAL